MTLRRLLSRFRHANSWSQRIRLAARCHDCDHIPKVPNAGQLEQWQGAPVQIMHNGVRVYAGGYHGHAMIEIIRRLRGHHEGQEEAVFHTVMQHLPDDAVMLEIGCFWAYYSLWFSHQKPSRRNMLVEPVAWKRKIGELNFTLNERPTQIDACYIADPSSDLEASTASGSAMLAGARPITIDDYLHEKQLGHLDLLHADIQGAELALLHGAAESLRAHRIDYVFISTHTDRHPLCRHELKRHGYVLLAEHSPDESFSADGLLVAASPRAPFCEPVTIARRN